MRSRFTLALAPSILCCLALCAPAAAQVAPPHGAKPAPKKSVRPAAKKPADASSEPKSDASVGARPASEAVKSSAAATPAAKPNAAQPKKQPASGKPSAGKTAKGGGERASAAVVLDPAKEAELKARLEEILKLPNWERIAELDDFLDQDLPAALADRAAEHLVSAEAAYGDERLAKGDTARGVELIKAAVADAFPEMSDRLYFEVVSQLPANLYLRGRPDDAFKAARSVERKVQSDARRLIALAPFYLSVERPEEAARIAEAAVKLAPDLSAAHQALGAARRLSLRLDEAAAAYARALELDPKSRAVRHSLADLRRAAGRAEEAAALYHELLAGDEKDSAARGGLALALISSGKLEEGGRELEAALKSDPRDIRLLAGAAYAYAARGDNKRALELGRRAVEIDPRHPWAQVALARALVASNMPFDAERSVRFARIHSRFPTLDYELANALAAAGLYEEAAEELARSFSVKGGRVSALLAGRVAADGADFLELLAPERRASLFQFDAADTESNARSLKGLLALHLALKNSDPAASASSAATEAAAVAAALDFAKGDDAMRSFRQLYAASRLLRRGVAPRAALDLVEAAKSGVDAGLDTPQATVAANADELRELRAQAVAQGSTPALPAFPRELLSSILRGRIEELTGWALLRQGQSAEAAAALRRAIGMLPAGSPYWRTAQWRLGTALVGTGERAEALDAYVRSYDPAAPDPVRRAAIESLYGKLNGTLKGLDIMIGRANAPSSPARAAAPTVATAAPAASATPAATAAGDPSASASQSQAAAPSTGAASPAETPEAKTAATAKPEPAAAIPAATQEPGAKLVEMKAVEAKPSEAKPVETKAVESAPAAPTETAQGGTQSGGDAAAAGRVRSRHTAGARGAAGCSLGLNVESLELAGGSGSASVVARLEGADDLSKVTATTPNWSDIVVVREPAAAAEPGVVKFTVNSVSKTPGAFVVHIKSPCGAKELAVNVK